MHSNLPNPLITARRSDAEELVILFVDCVETSTSYLMMTPFSISGGCHDTMSVVLEL